MNFFRRQKAKISEEDLLHFFKQLSTLFSAGVSLVQSLELLAQAEQKNSFRSLLFSLRQGLEQGREFHQGLKRYPQHFDLLSCQLLRIGEASGCLANMLHQVYLFRERKLALKNQIKQSLVYPTLVLCTALLTALSLLLFVVPHFALLYEQLPHQIPALTQALIHLSQNLAQYGLGLVLSLAAPSFWLVSRWKDPRFQTRCTEALTQLPFLQTLIHKILLARFARTLAMTLNAAIPLSEALILVSQLVRLRNFVTTVLELHAGVQAGKRFYSTLALNPFFPPLLVQMVKTGEESGTLEKMLEHFALVTETELERLSKRFNQVLPPLIILILGVLIGIIVIAMYLPIFNLGMAVE